MATHGESPAGDTRRWYQRIGPGLITACVVIGPGSILTSSKVGATLGYSMAWVVLASVACMMCYMTLGARLGVVSGATPGTIVAQRVGRWLAVLIGASIFFIAAAFQFGNNLGAQAAVAVYYDTPATLWVLNGLALAFLFAFRDLYRALERLMATLVGVMLISFAVNLVMARPDWTALARGFLPLAENVNDISVLAMIGTTFSVAAAYYQAYLVRQKGVSRDGLPGALVDARVGAVIMALITLMLMTTAAAVLGGQKLDDVGQVARALGPLFGERGQTIFCIGLFCAAYSSFLVNSMVGGYVLADGLGLPCGPRDMAPRLISAGVLLVGMFVAMYVKQTGAPPVGAIVTAQAITIVANPLLAGVLWWLANSRAVMGDARCGALLNTIAAIGFVILLIMAGYTAVAKVWPKLQPLFGEAWLLP